MIFLEVIL